MLVKSLEAEDYITHLNSTFQILRRYRMRLNPLKCAFGIASGKFLGYMVNQQGIDANPEKIEALCKMRSSQKPKEALGASPLLFKPKPGDILQLYLAIYNEAISSVLIWEERSTQLPVCYTSKALLSPKTRYPNMEKLALALIIASRKLRPYFRAHTIHILTNFPLRQARAAIKGSAGDVGSGAGVVLISPEGPKLTSAVRFGFKATNNVTEYEALLAGLRLATEMQVKRLLISNDSQLVFSQVNDALSKLASSKDSELLTVVPIEHLLLPSIEAPTIMWIAGTPTWMQSIIAYLKDQELLLSTPTVHRRRRGYPHIEGSPRGHVRQPLRRSISSTKIIEELTTISSPWPFSKWGVDLIGPLPKGRGGASFAIVAINYYTKWVEAEPLAKITEANTFKFLWKDIICRFGIPHSIISDNGRQFDNKKVRELCEELGIKKHFSTPHHPKLDVSKGAWVDELPQVLWAIRTTTRTPTGETPFLMAFGTEAMSPMEVGLPSPRCLHFSEITDDELRRLDLNFIEERRDDSQLKLGTYQRKMTRYFNSKVKKRSFRSTTLYSGGSSCPQKNLVPVPLFIRLLPRLIQFIRVHSLKFEAHTVFIHLNPRLIQLFIRLIPRLIQFIRVHSLKTKARSVVHSLKSKAHTVIMLK
ncbi:uncharacterized protein LOC111378680 [Olea europaea var. sylvestris]|uniref:uncharacterized protein LOC111378680 n=1 Tax=Olea europaea var. sylvestris TaxID=158386 RepID=UPI000C1D5C68|nr:uncharacterized protein LOC111378680 [Olea europaea var. sylvestris]